MQIFDSIVDGSKALPREERAMLLLAVIDFLHDGTEPDLDGVAEGMFTMIRPTLDELPASKEREL